VSPAASQATARRARGRGGLITSTAGDRGTPSTGVPVLLAGLGLGAVALVAVHFLHLNTYWDYSEGVYLFTSRLLLHGADHYGNVVAAQPPPLFAIGAAAVGFTLLGTIAAGAAVTPGAIAWSLVWTVAGGIAAKGGVTGAGDVGLASGGDDVVAFVSAIGLGAFAEVAGPTEVELVGVRVRGWRLHGFKT